MFNRILCIRYGHFFILKDNVGLKICDNCHCVNEMKQVEKLFT
jgi:hypothetical protein